MLYTQMFKFRNNKIVNNAIKIWINCGNIKNSNMKVLLIPFLLFSVKALFGFFGEYFKD